MGDQGTKGDKGDKGETGEKGDKGAPGTCSTWRKQEKDMSPRGASGKFVSRARMKQPDGCQSKQFGAQCLICKDFCKQDQHILAYAESAGGHTNNGPLVGNYCWCYTSDLSNALYDTAQYKSEGATSIETVDYSTKIPLQWDKFQLHVKGDQCIQVRNEDQDKRCPTSVEKQGYPRSKENNPTQKGVFEFPSDWLSNNDCKDHCLQDPHLLAYGTTSTGKYTDSPTSNICVCYTSNVSSPVYKSALWTRSGDMPPHTYGTTIDKFHLDADNEPWIIKHGWKVWEVVWKMCKLLQTDNTSNELSQTEEITIMQINHEELKPGITEDKNDGAKYSSWWFRPTRHTRTNCTGHNHTCVHKDAMYLTGLQGATVMEYIVFDTGEEERNYFTFDREKLSEHPNGRIQASCNRKGFVIAFIFWSASNKPSRAGMRRRLRYNRGSGPRFIHFALNVRKLWVWKRMLRGDEDMAESS